MDIQALFVDVGGVLLTNGWDRHARKKAAEIFNLNLEEFENRHQGVFDCYEIGKITLDEYLDLALFYQPRSFTVEQFKKFMFAQSQPLEPMLTFMKSIKKETSLKIFALSNEGKELMDHRIKTFGLGEWIDAFVVSSFVGLRKPDPDIYHLALHLAYCVPAKAAYIEDRQQYADFAEKMGIRAIHHVDYEKTSHALQGMIKFQPSAAK